MGRLSLAGLAVVILTVARGLRGQDDLFARPHEELPDAARRARSAARSTSSPTPRWAARSARTSGDNWVTVAFGDTLESGVDIENAYTRFALPNVRSGLSDVLRRYNNAVTLWHMHPSDSDLSLVVGCLR